MRRVAVVLIMAGCIFGTVALVVALDGGIPDADMPTPSGACSNAIGCHTIRSENGVLSLSAIANDGEWNTPGEPGSLKVTVNIDSANSEEDKAGVMLLDPDIADNIKAAGWSITNDPNSNTEPFNYNLKGSVIGDVDYIWTVNAPESLGTYKIYARAHFDDGSQRYNLSDTVEVSFPVDVSETGSIWRSEPSMLLTAHPSPFRETTIITYQLRIPSYVALEIYDVVGSSVRTLLEGVCTEGTHAVIWDGRDGLGRKAPEGVYFLRLQNGDAVSAGKTILLK